jgi:hypothetical protein
VQSALQRKQNLLDFRLQDIADAKRALGMDSEHARKLDGWRETERALNAEKTASESGGSSGASSLACPSGARPTGDGRNKLNCDDLSSFVRARSSDVSQ